MSTLSPRVYVACLGCYNAGRHHGTWADADDSLHSHLVEFFGPANPDEEGPRCSECNAEEFVVHDSEGFGSLKIGECGYAEAARVGQWLIDMDDRAELATHLHEHAWSHDYSDEALQSTADSLDEEYQGEFASIEDWAAQFHEDCGTVPKDFPLANYIDWSAVARDAELGGDVFTIELGGKVHVFWNR